MRLRWAAGMEGEKAEAVAEIEVVGVGAEDGSSSGC